MSPHLFLAHDGALYDTRDSAWSHKAPLRAGPYAWPGGYPLAFLTHDGACLCFKCGREEFKQIADSIREKHSDGWRVVACDIMYGEESDDSCDHCAAVIAACEKDSDNDDSTND